MCIFAKKFWLAFALLPVLALALGGCASARPAEPGYASRDPNSRLPETGTNIPRRIRVEADERRAKSDRTAKSKPTKEKGKPAEAKKPERAAVDEDVVLRGGFR